MRWRGLMMIWRILWRGESLWRRDLGEGSATGELVASVVDLAAAVGVEAADLVVSGIAVLDSEEVLVSVAGKGELLVVGVDDGSVRVLIDSAAIIGVTGEVIAEVGALAVDPAGVIYVADEVSGSILQISPVASIDGQEITYEAAYFTTAEDIGAASEVNIKPWLETGTVSMSGTALAQASAEALFAPNSLVIGSGVYGQEGEFVYYVTQLGSTGSGEGGITRIVANEDEPTEATFESFFDEAGSGLTLDPSALVLDVGGAFGNLMYMGTFGASMGDDFDGTVYSVDAEGNISEFVTAFVDVNGDPVLMDGQEVDGFFDVTDMAFSVGGPFGEYLYVLSENIDSNGTEEGGFSSDLWRVDPQGVAELFVPDIGAGVISLAFGNAAYSSDGENGDLFVASFLDTGEIWRVYSDGTSELFTQLGYSREAHDIAFAPEMESFESEVEGQLVVVFKDGDSGGFGTIAVDAEVGGMKQWTTGLQSGDVSSG